LGGLVTLLAARQKPIAAAALLSPIPPDGVLRSMVALGRRSPVSLLKMLMVATDARITRYGTPPLGVYSETCDPALAAATTQKLRGESLLALAQTLVRRRGGSAPPNTPLHFFGAEGDYIIPAAEVRRSARLFNAPVTIYPGMSHSFQVERDWAVMAGDIRDWLAGL
jgi:pimeloyl-ACP methyl ester carboxylesterase